MRRFAKVIIVGTSLAVLTLAAASPPAANAAGNASKGKTASHHSRHWHPHSIKQQGSNASSDAKATSSMTAADLGYLKHVASEAVVKPKVSEAKQVNVLRSGTISGADLGYLKHVASQAVSTGKVSEAKQVNLLRPFKLSSDDLGYLKHVASQAVNTGKVSEAKEVNLLRPFKLSSDDLGYLKHVASEAQGKQAGSTQEAKSGSERTKCSSTSDNTVPEPPPGYDFWFERHQYKSYTEVWSEPGQELTGFEQNPIYIKSGTRKLPYQDKWLTKYSEGMWWDPVRDGWARPPSTAWDAQRMLADAKEAYRQALAKQQQKGTTYMEMVQADQDLRKANLKLSMMEYFNTIYPTGGGQITTAAIYTPVLIQQADGSYVEGGYVH